MEIDKITLEREFLDKLLSLNYLNLNSATL